MTNFMNMLENETKKEKTFTENGALAYATAGKSLLDFLFATTALRKEDEKEIMREITKVYFEDSLVANKFFFWERDCRGGNGERKIFRAYLVWLATNKPDACKAIIPLVSEYGRWDDLWCLLDTKMKDDVCALVKKQFNKDIEDSMNNKPISLLAKWMCSENASSKQTKHYATILRTSLGLADWKYRKTLSRLRAYLDVVEVKTSSNRWNEINYETVPSQANIKYTDAFMKHDKERREEYLESLKNGEAKINASVLQPHEIVAKYLSRGFSWSTDVGEYDEALEQLWKALPVKSLDNTLVVRDGSGSMTSGYGTKVRPLDVATALAVYMADHNKGIWKDKFITFSANPKFIDLSNCTTLRDKLIKTYDEDECSNTDIEKTMMLILNTAISNHCSQDDMPKQIVIVSDMGWDSATYQYNNRSGIDESLFDYIAKEYANAGYMLPRIIFWNVAGQTGNGVPMQQNELGVVLMSGFNIQLLDMIMLGKTDPYEAILDIINSDRYQPVEDAIKNTI